MQSNDVKYSFDINLFEGLYYEIMFHDYTQKPGCPGIRCVRSVKTFNKSYNYIYDNFTIHCVGQTEYYPFIFNLTDEIGFFYGILANKPQLKTYPDTVIAFGPIINDNNKLQYQWVIEMQCIDHQIDNISQITFVGLNFYCHDNNPSQQIINEMINAAKKQGLDIYMDPLYYVNQTDCTYP